MSTSQPVRHHQMSPPLVRGNHNERHITRTSTNNCTATPTGRHTNLGGGGGATSVNERTASAAFNEPLNLCKKRDLFSRHSTRSLLTSSSKSNTQRETKKKWNSADEKQPTSLLRRRRLLLLLLNLVLVNHWIFCKYKSRDDDDDDECLSWPQAAD